MKSRFFLLSLCLIFLLGLCASVNAVEKASDSQKETAAAAADDIPEVPENGTLKDYLEYHSNLKDEFQRKAQTMHIQAQQDGVDTKSEEFLNSFKSMSNEYLSRMEQALDKALQLNDLSGYDFVQLVNEKSLLIGLMWQINNDDEAALKTKIHLFASEIRKMGKNELAEKLADEIDFKAFDIITIGYVKAGKVKEFEKAAAEIDEKVEKAGKNITHALALRAFLITKLAKELPEYKIPEERLEKYFRVLSESSEPDVKIMAKVIGQQLKVARPVVKYKPIEDDNDIPEVPENLTYEKYQEYVKELYDMYSAQGRKMARQAHEDGVDSQSKEYGNAIEAMSQKYFSRMEQAIDKALLIKDLTDEQFEYLAIDKVRLVMINDDEKTVAKTKAFIEQLRKSNKAKIADNADFHFFRERVYNCIGKRDAKTLAKIAAEIDEQIDNAGENISPVLAKKAAVIVGALQDAVFLAQRMKKYNMAISKAINAKDITDEDLSELAVGKLRLIALSAGNNPEDVKTLIGKMEAFVDQLRKMDKEKAADEAEDIVFQFKINLYISRGDVKEFAKVAAKIDKKVEKVGKEINVILARNMITVIQAGMAIPNYTAPEGRLEKYYKALSQASDLKVKSAANVLERIMSNVKAKSAKGDLDKYEK